VATTLRWFELKMSERTKSLIAAVVVALFGAYVANIGTGFPLAKGFVQPNGDIPDVVRDWLSVRAIVAEGLPTDPISELAQIHLGVVLEGLPHPRTPGALLLQLPLAFVPAGWVWPVMTGLVLLAAAAIVWMSVRLGGWRWPWIVAFGVPLMLTEPMQASILLGSQAPLVGAMAAGAWLIVRNRDSGWAGMLVGLAVTLKLFPALLVPILWVSNRRRTSYTALAVFAGLNLPALLLPGVSISGAIDVLSPPVETWPSNLALGLSPLAIAILGSLAVWLAHRVKIDSAMSLGIVTMVGLSPVVWNHYLIILLAPAVWLLGEAIFSGINRLESRFVPRQRGKGRDR
jgi:hypothetical protein